MVELIKKSYLGIETFYNNSFYVIEFVFSNDSYVYLYKNVFTGKIYKIILR